MPTIKAIIFDLYGTLLEGGGSSLHRKIPTLLGVPMRRWMDLVKSRLLTTSFPDADTFVSEVCEALGAGGDPSLQRRCKVLVDNELDSVAPFDGALSLLLFLRRRGYRLGLLSNLASIYVEPVHRLGLAEHFDAMMFSCVEGHTKPHPDLYHELCSRLGVRPEETLFVGDSLSNDVVTPSRLGLQTLWIRRAPPAGKPAERASVPQVAELGCLPLIGTEPLRPMLEEGQTLNLASTDLTVAGIRPLPDSTQGRYNLVYTVDAEPGGHSLIVKRFLSPASAHVEELAHRMQAYVGLSSCEAAVVDAPEPLLVVSKARGEKYGGEMDRDIALELGRHTVFAYVFSNADMRPRNAVVELSSAGPRVTMIDLEHCFFNLAIHLSDLPETTSPQAVDRLGESTLRDRVKKSVLTPRTLPRTVRAFFDREARSRRELYAAYCDGFLDTYGRLASDVDAICDRLRDRIYREPYLVIGTRAYRRVMAGIDLQDIRSRLVEDPRPLLDHLWPWNGPSSG